MRPGTAERDGSIFAHSQRHPPSNLQAEQALLGALFANNQVYARVSHFLRPEHFADPIHSRLYQAAAARIEAGQLADAVTLRSDLEHSGVLDEVGGTAYLAELLTAMVGILNAPEYARTIHGCWVRRRLIDIGESVVNNAFTEPGEAEQIERAQEEMELLLEQAAVLTGKKEKRGRTTFAEAVQESIDRADGITAGRIARPASTGIEAIDKVLGGGLFPETLIYMLGLGQAGKTELALSIAESVAQKAMADWTVRMGSHAISVAADLPSEHPGKCPGVLFFSFDMTARQLGDRGTARLSGVPLWRLRKGDIDADAASMLRDIPDSAARIPIDIDDAGPPTLAHIRAETARYCANRPCALVIVDNASNVASYAGTDKLFGTYIHMTAELKRLAVLHRVPFMLLMHLNSGIMHRPDPTPKTGDIPWGTQKDADTAFAVWRPILAMPKTAPQAPLKMTQKGEEMHAKAVAEWHNKRDRLKGVTELIPLKLREDDSGDGGEIARVRFDNATRRFERAE